MRLAFLFPGVGAELKLIRQNALVHLHPTAQADLIRLFGASFGKKAGPDSPPLWGRFTNLKTGDAVCYERGMSRVKTSVATGACLTMSQSLGPRKRRGAEFKVMLQRAFRSPTR